jgi:(2R)-ethylmalonyl-CoA mutase
MGVRAVYTPKDYAIDAIMVGLAKVVEKSLDRSSGPSEPPREGAQVY